MVEIFDRELPEFQNISCYCLTATKLQHIGNLQIFQNISCYCLTPEKMIAFLTKMYFKTSHVIV